MKARSLQEHMQHALQMTSRVTPARTTMPIIQNTLMRVMDGAVELTATNLEMTLRMRIPADIEREGSLAVPNRLLSEFVGTLPKGTVEMERPGETTVLRLKCGDTKANINGANANLFPPMPEVEESNTVIMESDEFRKAVVRVAHCAATETNRPALTGILMDLDEDNLTTVGADGFRLAVQRSKLTGPVGRPARAVVPAKTLIEVQRIAGNVGGQVEILIPEDGKTVRFRIGAEGEGNSDIEVTSLLLAGTYPAYQDLVPQDMPNQAGFKLGELSNATRRAEIFARDAQHAVQFEMSRASGERGRALITSKSNQLGDNRAELETEMVRGSAVSITLNGRYIQEALSSLNSKQVALETASGSSPAKMTTPDEGDDYVHVMMPIMTLGDQ